MPIDPTPRGRPRVNRPTTTVAFKALDEDDAAVRQIAAERGVECAPVLREALHLGLALRLPLARTIWALAPDPTPEGVPPPHPAAGDLVDLYAAAVLGWPRKEFRPPAEPGTAQAAFQARADAQEALERAGRVVDALRADLGLPPLPATAAEAWELLAAAVLVAGATSP